MGYEWDMTGILWNLASGYQTWLVGKSSMNRDNQGVLRGKSSVNGPFSSTPCLFTRGYPLITVWNLDKCGEMVGFLMLQ